MGALCVTYCVGGLSVCNSIAGAYAEKSPVVMITGSPGLRERVRNPLLHHMVRNFRTQYDVFEKLCIAGTELDDPASAFREIDRVLAACQRFKRPVYIEIPRDMVHVRPDVTPPFQSNNPKSDTRALSEAQLRFRPAEGAWSIAEVAQHVLHVEREVAKAAMKPGVERRGRRRTPRELVGMIAFLAVVKLNFRIRVPQKVAGRVTPATDPDMEALWSEWRSVHANLAEHLETVRAENLGDMAFKHPIVGPTSVRRMLLFLLQHFDHHMRQVRRIRASRGFPSG